MESEIIRELCGLHLGPTAGAVSFSRTHTSSKEIRMCKPRTTLAFSFGRGLKLKGRMLTASGPMGFVGQWPWPHLKLVRSADSGPGTY